LNGRTGSRWRATAQVAAIAAVISIALSNAPLKASPLAGVTDTPSMSAAPEALVQVQTNKKKKKRRAAKGPPYIPGWVPTAYGRRDCIGWWHWHEDEGWYHCHGQLIKPW